MTHKNIKSEEFYSRFHNQLNESQNWPGEYLFKFIVKDNSDEFKSLKKYLNNYKEKILKSSSNNKFISISFRYTMLNSPNDVIKSIRKLVR